MKKLYVIKKQKEYYNAKSNDYSTEKQFATVFINYNNAFKIIQAYRLDAEVVEIDALEHEKLMAFVSYDLSVKLEATLYYLLSFKDKFQGFTAVNKMIISLVEQLIKLLRKNNDRFEHYTEKTDGLTLDSITDLQNIHKELSMLPSTEYSVVLKYLVTKNKKIKL